GAGGGRCGRCPGPCYGRGRRGRRSDPGAGCGGSNCELSFSCPSPVGFLFAEFGAGGGSLPARGSMKRLVMPVIIGRNLLKTSTNSPAISRLSVTVAKKLRLGLLNDALMSQCSVNRP